MATTDDSNRLSHRNNRLQAAAPASGAKKQLFSSPRHISSAAAKLPSSSSSPSSSASVAKLGSGVGGGGSGSAAEVPSTAPAALPNKEAALASVRPPHQHQHQQQPAAPQHRVDFTVRLAAASASAARQLTVDSFEELRLRKVLLQEVSDALNAAKGSAVALRQVKLRAVEELSGGDGSGVGGLLAHGHVTGLGRADASGNPGATAAAAMAKGLGKRVLNGANGLRAHCSLLGACRVVFAKAQSPASPFECLGAATLQRQAAAAAAAAAAATHDLSKIAVLRFIDFWKIHYH